MKLNVNVLSENQIESTTTTKKMKLSDNAKTMVFQMFTKNIYSNPIGTVVREITSNCFDSHIEAGVNHPVLIKLTKDEQTDVHHISFIDYGVGMSPERIEKVYSVYFESTKRLTDNEIGGFGVGGKTPLAYKKSIGSGENEYDNSFFVITNYNGTKYYYNIYEGPESPEYSLFHKESTTERNGTEVRIPVLKSDILTFEREMRNQLYYFENIVFEGFSDTYVSNDYKIIESENFFHRGTDVDNEIHISLGRVYYPINYSTLGISKFDYQIPIAIKVPIGEVNVTVSREQLDYSDKTIKYLKKRLSEVKEELRQKLNKQYENIVTLEDYFKFKNNFGQLQLTGEINLDLKGLIQKDEIDLSNFRYLEHRKIANSSATLLDLLFIKGKYGKKKSKSSNDLDNYVDIINHNNIYYVDGDFKRKMIKQSYLKYAHESYYILRKANLFERAGRIWNFFNLYSTYPTHNEFITSELFITFQNIQDEYFDIVRNNAENYDELEIPEDFKSNYGRRAIGKDILKKTIPIKLSRRHSKYRVTIESLINFNGKIFYGDTNDIFLADKVHRIFNELFNIEHVVRNYSHYNKKVFGNECNIMFVTVAKNNIKYLKYCKNAYPLTMFREKMLYRKVDTIIHSVMNKDIVKLFDNINEFYTSEMFTSTFPKYNNLVKTIKEYIDNNNTDIDINDYKEYLRPLVDVNSINKPKEINEIEKLIIELNNVQEKNWQMLRYIRIPGKYSTIVDSTTDGKILPEILKKILVV